jgi:hypothetical protein
MFKDSFSEGGIYPLRALMTVVILTTAVMVIVR